MEKGCEGGRQMKKHWLKPPEWSWNSFSDENPTSVSQWIKSLQSFQDIPDLIVYGAPISRSSISVSGASLYPSEFRRMWKSFSTYNIDEDVDLASFKVADAGDIDMHTTDIPLSHQRIQQTTAYLTKCYPTSRICMIGGDHSTTACAVRGIKEMYPFEKIGILQLDTHLDVRDPRILGPANGTPIRQLIDDNTVMGKHIMNIGPHGYFNAKSLIDYAKKHSINIITLQAARKKGVSQTVKESLQHLSNCVDRIYVTVDMDVLDISFAPGVPASTPGGMSTSELFDSLIEIGKEPAVKHIDFVCLDPSKDSSVQETVKIGCYAWLQYVTGCVLQDKE